MYIIMTYSHNYFFPTKKNQGIYTVEGKSEDLEKHMLTIIGYGYTKERKLFFVVQNSWGEDSWGVKGYGRIMIDDKSEYMLIYPS